MSQPKRKKPEARTTIAIQNGNNNKKSNIKSKSTVRFRSEPQLAPSILHSPNLNVKLPQREAKSKAKTRKNARAVPRSQATSLAPLEPPLDSHLYIPRLHRQQTEKLTLTQLGSALATLAEDCLGEELDAYTRATATLELTGLVDMVFQALSRNLWGLTFLQPVFSHCFLHWTERPQRRVVCFLPIRLPKVQAHPQSFGTAYLQLPRTFAPQTALDTLDLISDGNSNRYLSIRKLYAVVLKLLGRALLGKNVPNDRLHFSSNQRLLEINLLDAKGWIGEVVPCLVVGQSSTFFCCKAYNTGVNLERFLSPDRRSGRTSKNADTSPNLSEYKSTILSVTPTQRSGRKMKKKTRQDKDEKEDNKEDDEKEKTESGVETCEDEKRENCGENTEEENEDTENLDEEIGDTEETESFYTGFTPSKYSDSQSPASRLPRERVPHYVNGPDEYANIVDSWDATWYMCSPKSEQSLVHSISLTDNGVRTSAMHVVCRLSEVDWRLQAITCYHVQTVMLHDAEHQLDHTPRWQRNSLEHCTRSLLERLRHFLQMARLPHFFLAGVNLWEGLSDKRLELARGALDRLTSSESSLTSLVCRSGGFSLPGEVDIYSSLLKAGNLGEADKKKTPRGTTTTTTKTTMSQPVTLRLSKSQALPALSQNVLTSHDKVNSQYRRPP